MNFKQIKDFLIERTRNHTSANTANIGTVINMAMRTVVRQRERSFLNLNLTKNTISGQYSGYAVDNQDLDYIRRITVPAEGVTLTELPI